MSDEGLAISVVAPCHNEVENVEPLVEEVRKVLDGIGRTWEIVLVDDGSTDGTWEAIGR
jgi:glycosyltransferase involved in cell wall biosynthesis